MLLQTDTVGTKDWLRVSKNLKVKAYIENYMSTANVHGRYLEQPIFIEEMKKIGVLFPLQSGGEMRKDICASAPTREELSQEETRWAKLYAECAEEDRELAEEGLSRYVKLLQEEEASYEAG